MKLFSVFPECRYRANPECPDLPMLWRANLYVDEGPNDWNNRHPWDDPTNNEWFVSKTSGADKDGGQISISSWTQPYLPYNPADIKYRNVSEAVPYTFGGVDSLPQFNSEMNEQRTAMVAASQLSNNNPYIGWNKTLAPKNKWGNYLDSSYRPCLTYLIEATNTYTGCTMAAGVDCGGFITRIASYRDTPHLIAKSRGVTLTEARHDSFVKNADGSFTCNTAARDCYPPIFENNSDLTNILPYVYQISVSNPSAPGQYDFSRLIPGDIVFMNFHIMMVSSIQRRDTGQLKPEDIFFIEATTWNEMYNVQKSQTMDFYLNQFDNNLANYIFGRLK
jgi:hypothetical protein